MEDKKSIVDDVFGKFHEKFGFYPESTGSYYMDADLTNYIKATYPTVKCAVATCWEEGPKAYHTCNNSWYTFMDGGPWAPWIPSKQNTHAPAANEAEDSGIVAIPICPEICWHAMTVTAPISEPIPRTYCVV